VNFGSAWGQYTEGKFRLSIPDFAPIATPALRADAARNRIRVLDAAREAFGERGHEAQIEDIARRAGVGVGTVYRHFPTKENLVAAVSERRWQEVVAHLEGECLTAEDPWTGFERMLYHAGEIHERDRGFAQVVEATLGSAKPQGEIQRTLSDRAAELMRRAQSAGTLRSDAAPEDLASVFCALAAVASHGAGDWRRYVALVLDGLRAR
jgi:AcrR family transcriptional regulator